MPTNQDQLDRGPPPIDLSIDPSALPTEAQRQYGAAFLGLLGTRDVDENAFGTALVRAPVLISSQPVSGHTTTLAASGAVTALTVRIGSVTGGYVIIPEGPPSTREVRITYDAQFVPTLSFNAADNVTSVSLTQLQIPTEFIEMMQASNP